MKRTGDVPRWRRISRRVRWIILVIVVLLVAFRLALPSIVKSYVNRQLSRSSDYDGRIKDVDIHLWRGAYRINDIEIFKTTGKIRQPFFAARELDLSIQWKELFHGAVVGEVVMREPHLNFVAGPTEAETQTGKEARWDKVLESLFPFKLNRLEIREGQVHFQNDHSNPKVDISLDQLFATATNLSNSRDLKTELPAGLQARGTTIGGGNFDLNLHLNPMAEFPTYEVNCQLTNVNLVALNDFLKAYGKFDVERGVFALFASVASKDGRYEGYLKVFFNDLDVFAWEKERQKNALEVFWQAIVGTLATVFKNQPKDQLATRVPISGSYQGQSVGVLSAVGTLLRHAFVRALVPKLDEPMTIEKVDEVAEEKRKRLHALPPIDQKGAESLIHP